MPVVCCGYETIWDLRCLACGGFAWFDAEQDQEFRRALTAARTQGGDSVTQQAETDRLFMSTLPSCRCGGAFRVVREWDREPCLQCGRPLEGGALEPRDPVEVPAARAK